MRVKYNYKRIKSQYITKKRRFFMKNIKILIKASLILTIALSSPLHLSGMVTKEQETTMLRLRMRTLGQQLNLFKKLLNEMSDPKMSTKEEIEANEDMINYYKDRINQLEQQMEDAFQRLKELNK